MAYAAMNPNRVCRLFALGISLPLLCPFFGLEQAALIICVNDVRTQEATLKANVDLIGPFR
jgi:hypothetical protein